MILLFLIIILFSLTYSVSSCLGKHTSMVVENDTPAVDLNQLGFSLGIPRSIFNFLSISIVLGKDRKGPGDRSSVWFEISDAFNDECELTGEVSTYLCVRHPKGYVQRIHTGDTQPYARDVIEIFKKTIRENQERYDIDIACFLYLN